jgi:hypothetical protein
MLDHVYKKMNLFEKFKFYRIKRKYVKTLRKMDRAILIGNMEKAYMYEDKMYQCDEMVEAFMHEMHLKYS